MASLSNGQLAQIVKGLNTVRSAQHRRRAVAAGVFFAYDWMLTLGMEIELIWKAKWTYIKVLYLFQRYLTFYDTFYASYLLMFGKNLSKETCKSLFTQMRVSYLVGIIAAETLCSIRIWAVWNKDRRFFIILPICAICIWGPATAAMASAIVVSQYTDAPYRGFVGCFNTNAKDIHLEYVWACLLAYDAISLVLVMIPGIRIYHQGLIGRSRLSHVVFRDGVIYYITLFLFSLLNIIFSVSLESATRSSLANMGRALHSTLASRVVLHMRDTVHTPRSDYEVAAKHMRASNVHFTRTVHRDDGAVIENVISDDFMHTMHTTTDGSDTL
ncbi:hypothetical protein JR316_0011407 [Psilocybe cubensis]|uniref:DUF6533 domain-containing protein n=2 Tax=Psilocybe cubensis TaxID=181762 RepID=A0A8H8CI06_PSICU|nr:hypothetical protein JR316_0011407 [Psilocybe cubensis]KAH9475847.1 hypothetical protein JR316_0011407 [Psilocybe cubensis]